MNNNNHINSSSNSSPAFQGIVNALTQAISVLPPEIREQIINQNTVIQVQNEDVQNANVEVDKKTDILQKKSWSKAEKIAVVIRAVREGNLTKIAKEVGKSESTVRGWKEQYSQDIEEKIKEENISIKRKRRREPKFIKMEKEVLKEIMERREKKLAISMKEIQMLASDYAKKLYPGEKFTGSHEWFSRFVRRYNLSRRTATHTMQKACEDFKEVVESFWKKIHQDRFDIEVMGKIPDKNKVVFLNMDEVSFSAIIIV